MYVAFPRSDYYEDSVTILGHQLTAGLPAATLAGQRGGQPRIASPVHHAPVGGVGVQLCPCSIATPTPHAFDVASRPARITDQGVTPDNMSGVCAAIPAHIPQVGAGAIASEAFRHAGSSRTPFRLARRTRTVWECRSVPPLSRLLSALPCTSRIRLPSASPACCDRPAVESFHPHLVSWRLVAHLLVNTEDHGMIWRSGGFMYSPTMSRTLSMKRGSFDSLKVSTR